MATFGYKQLYSNGLNSFSQVRRSTDMIYQRGATYQVTLTGDTYVSSMELDVNMFVATGTSSTQLVGKMTLVPYNISATGSSYFEYNFNVRPYDYLSNFVESEHYQYYWLNDWVSTYTQLNFINPYRNIIQASYRYAYKYVSGGTQEYENAGFILNDLDHYSSIPINISQTGVTASGTTNTGENFDLVGGAFQMGQDKFLLPNYDQEIGTVLAQNPNSGITFSTIDSNRMLSPMSQYLMDYPSFPQMSETGRFLTDAPRIQYIQSEENYVLYFLQGQTGDRQVIESDFVQFDFYDENNDLLYTIWDQVNGAVGGTYGPYVSPTGYTDNLKISVLPCGPNDINNIFGGLDFTDIAYYTVQLCYGYPTQNTSRLSEGPLGPISELFYFYLNGNCGPDNTRLAFLNSKGGFDYFTFTSYRNDVKKITTQSYDSRYYATDLNTPDRNVGRTVKTFGTDVNREIVLESDYLSVPYGQWLEQLFYSPQVYEMKIDFISPLDRQDKVFKDLRPVQILSTEVETITKKHRKLNKYRITLKYADTFFVNKGF